MKVAVTILVDKVASALAYPLGFALCGLLAALCAFAFGARRKGIAASASLVVLLWAASIPVTARALLSTLEAQYPASAIETYPAVDVIIVLGGGVRPANEANPYPDLGEASDRAIHAYRLYRAGKAPHILLSGGPVLGAATDETEAGAMAELLVGLGVDRSHLIIEDKSRNTHENAVETALIWRRDHFRSALLITSAAHMPRALAAFRQTGMAVEPAPTDIIHGSIKDPFPLSVLPDSESLDRTTKALKEWLGLIVYRWRGWA